MTCNASNLQLRKTASAMFIRVDANVESPHRQIRSMRIRSHAFRDCFIAEFRGSRVVPPKFSRRVTRIQLTVSVSLRSTRGRARITPACVRAMHREEDARISGWRMRQLLRNARSRAQRPSFTGLIPPSPRAPRPKG